jgi:hypothetical protein
MNQTGIMKAFKNNEDCNGGGSSSPQANAGYNKDMINIERDF